MTDFEEKYNALRKAQARTRLLWIPLVISIILCFGLATLLFKQQQQLKRTNDKLILSLEKSISLRKALKSCKIRKQKAAK